VSPAEAVGLWTDLAFVIVHSILKPRPLGGLTFIGYAIEPLRAEACLHATSTPGVEAVLAAGYRNDVGESNEAMACTPRLGLQRRFVLILSGRCGITANPIPSLLNADQIKALSYGRGCFIRVCLFAQRPLAPFFQYGL
jgi:hypothetical protein